MIHKTIGKARGIVITDTIYPYRGSIVPEQISTSKRNIEKRFAALDINADEIEWISK